MKSNEIYKLSEIDNKVKIIIENLLGLNCVLNKDSIREDLFMDSLDILELIMYIENEFSISITESDEDKIMKDNCTVNDLIKFIYNRVNN